MQKQVLLILLLLIGFTPLLAQSRTSISGFVRDGQNNPVPGATIQVKGTNTGTTALADGRFRINVPTGATTLVVSAIGFITQQIAVGSASEINVVLAEDPRTLGEVIVTGFGVKQEARKLAYAAQEVKGMDLERANNANLVNALQGKVAGVQIDQGAGGPMSSSRIRIRGNASLSPNTQPLFVIDGVLIRPGTSGADSWGGGIQDFGNIMKNINADNVETMTVLKGSAASALYGSEALNGVIVITTKRGREQKGLGVSYNHTSSFENAFRFVDVQNEYGAGVTPTFSKGTDGVEEVDRTSWFYSFGPKLDGRMVRDLDGRMIPWVANDPLKFFQTGKFINHNVAIDGGNERSSFRVSYSNLYNNTIMPGGAEMKRNNFNVRANQKIGRIINLDVVTDYTVNDNLNPIRQGSGFNPVFRYVYNRPRSLDMDYWVNNYTSPNGGRKQGAADPYNITPFLWDTYQKNTIQTEKIFRANVDVNVSILPWLTGLVRANLQNELYQTDIRELGDGAGFSGNDRFVQAESTNSQSRIQGLLTASRDLTSTLHLNLNIGGETNQVNGGRYYELGTNGGLRIPRIFALSNSVNPVNVSSRLNPSKRTDAVYAYGDLSYKDMLFLNFTNRIDYTSTLTYADGSGQHSYYYPSVGLAWDFTQAVKNLPKALTFGKLRASYGFTGGDTDAWRTNRTGFYSAFDPVNFNSVNGPIAQYGFRDNTLPNYSLKNRLAREWEVGADLRFFNNRLGIDVAVYNKLTRNEIFTLPVAQESGIGSRLVNAGKIMNRGVEILLSGTPIKTSKFQWNTLLNFSRNRNKILELADGIDTYELRLAFGNDVRSVAKAGGDYGTIVSTYAYARDEQGRKIIGAASGTTGGYLTYLRSGAAGQGAKELGTMLEKYLLSNVNNFRYGNFSATLQIDSKIGGVMASGTHQYGSANGSFANSLFGRDAESGGVAFTDKQGVKRNDGIIPDGVLNKGVTATVDGKQLDLGGMTYKEAVDKGYLTPIPAYAYYDNLSNWGSGIREYSVFENSWVAVREASIGYDIPANLLNKVKLQTMRLSVVGRNLGYLYRTAKDGINPQSLKSNEAGEFAEYGGLPFSRNLGFSVNVGF